MSTPKDTLDKQKKRARILAELRAMSNPETRSADAEVQHVQADARLLELIDDQEITEAYRAIERWYA